MDMTTRGKMYIFEDVTELASITKLGEFSERKKHAFLHSGKNTFYPYLIVIVDKIKNVITVCLYIVFGTFGFGRGCSW